MRFRWFRRQQHAHPAFFAVGFLVSVVSIVPVTAQTDAELAALEKQISEAVQQIEQQLLQAGQQIEDEQQALMQKLGTTHDALQAERERTAALEARLRALTGEGPTAPQTPATFEGEIAEESARWLQLPERKVGPLGLVVRSTAAMGPVPTGTEAVALRWPPNLTAPEDATAPQVVIDGARTLFRAPSVLGQDVVIASMEVSEGRVLWTWHALSPAQHAALFRYLDSALPRSTFEARRAGVSLGAFQLKPREMYLPPNQTGQATATLRPGLGELALAAEPTPPGWEMLPDSPREAGWVSLTSSWVVRVGTDPDTVTVRRGTGVRGRLRELQRQRQGWERDLTRPAQDADSVVPDRQRIEQEIQRIDALHAQLDAVRQRLEANPHDVQAPVVRLRVAGGSAVLGRLHLTTEGR